MTKREMTIEEAIEIIMQFRDRQGNSSDDIEAFDIAIQVLEQTRWIPVSKELPEENIHVLCQFYIGGMTECYHAHGVWHIVGGYRISFDEVVAWMPLPEPYRSESRLSD